jgi:hypothetical protein
MQSLKLQYEVMIIDSAGTSGGIVVLWNEAEVSAEGWIGCPRNFISYFLADRI